MMMRAAALIAFCALAFATPVAAKEKIYSYDPADAATKARVDNGLTFIFNKGLLGFDVTAVLATQAHAEADLRPAGEKELKIRLEDVLPKGSTERQLYAVEDKAQGLAMVRAFCPGSSHGWLVFSALRPRTGAVVHALGDDPVSGKARLCATMNFNFRGEWALPTGSMLTNPSQGPGSSRF